MDKKTELQQKIQHLIEYQKKSKEIAEHIVEGELNTKKDFWEIEKEHLDEKKRFLADILDWKNKFIKEYANIFKVKAILQIFRWNWAHTKPDMKDDACWSVLELTKDGKLIYKSGYKWMPHKEKIELNQNTINKLIYSYLKELHNFVMSDDVYKKLINCLKEENTIWIEKGEKVHLVDVKDKRLSAISIINQGGKNGTERV